MLRAGTILSLCLLVTAGGCQTEQHTASVTANPFDSAPTVAPRPKLDLSLASVEAAQRVDMLGRKLVAANQQAGLGRPLFRTIGAPQQEIFHRGMQEVDITEGLVRQCTSDAQLAAVLCLELGKMVAERELTEGPALRTQERRPPMDAPVGNDVGGTFGAPDGTHLAELGMYERDQRKSGGSYAPNLAPTPPPDPAELARIYLKKGGYSDKDLDSVSSLLAAAAQNTTFETNASRSTLNQASWTSPAAP